MTEPGVSEAAEPDDEAASSSSPVPLRLAVSGGQLGLELYRAVPFGPLSVERLAYSLPHVKFPSDLSRGVRPFRHQRGLLQELVVRGTATALSAWLGQRWRALMDGGQRRPTVWFTELGIGIGVTTADGPVAFELLWAPVQERARWVVDNARGVGEFRGAVLGHVLHLLGALGHGTSREGRCLLVPHAPREVARAVLPPLGARLPGCQGVVLGGWQVGDDGASVTWTRDVGTAAYEAPTLRAVQLAELLRVADDALAEGDPERARSEYVTALEQAPRAPDVVRTIAELDLRVAGREHAALGLLVETLPAIQAGVVGMELLARVGDLHAAWQTAERLCSAEPYGPFAAAVWQRLAQRLDDVSKQRQALDYAVAASPGLLGARWARLELRARVGDLPGALADAEHLEASAHGSKAKHEVMRSAARRLLDYGYVRDAGVLFERALRYLPNDAEATLGLAEALLEAGKVKRVPALLGRVLQLCDHGPTHDRAQIVLARLLAETYHDLPQAVARVRAVASDIRQVIEARALEGRWRSEIGDLAGASLAYARLRETCELELASAPPGASAWMCEAASFETSVKGDLAAAERLLATALRLRPHDRRVQSLYRSAAKALSLAQQSS